MTSSNSKKTIHRCISNPSLALLFFLLLPVFPSIVLTRTLYNVLGPPGMPAPPRHGDEGPGSTDPYWGTQTPPET